MLIRSTRRSEGGSALVELIFALPLLVLVLVGTADFARVFYTAIELTNAARAGVQYAAYSPGRFVDTAAIQSAAMAAAPDIGLATTDVTVDNGRDDAADTPVALITTPAPAAARTNARLPQVEAVESRGISTLVLFALCGTVVISCLLAGGYLLRWLTK